MEIRPLYNVLRDAFLPKRVRGNHQYRSSPSPVCELKINHHIIRVFSHMIFNWSNNVFHDHVSCNYQYGLFRVVEFIFQCSSRNVNSCHVSKVFTTLSYLWFTCVSDKAWSWSVMCNLFGLKKSSSKLRQSHKPTLFNFFSRNYFCRVRWWFISVSFRLWNLFIC